MSDSSPRPRSLQRTLHVATLWAFAVAQPLLSVLPERHVYLHDFQPQWPELIGLTGLLFLLLPGLLIVLDRRLLAWSPRNSKLAWLQDAVLLSLGFLIALLFVRTFATLTAVRVIGVPWFVLVGLAALVNWGLHWLYRKLEVFRQLVTASGLALLVFPVYFLMSMAPVVDKVSAAKTYAVQPVEKPVPVVLVVFDEFCGMTLMNRERQIDSQRFPNFAALAQQSNWYRHATSNHGQTDKALPLLLTGQLPVDPDEREPHAVSTNLFEVIRQSNQFDMAVFEPVSRLCNEEINPHRQQRRPFMEQLGTLCHTLACVYPHLVKPLDAPLRGPEIPQEWFGLSGRLTPGRKQTRGLFRYFWTSEREIQLCHFLDCLPTAERPKFCFMHVVLPHFPWAFLPSGEHYVADGLSVLEPPGVIEEHWSDDDFACEQAQRRYFLQAGFVDRFIGELRERMEQAGTWDKSLVIVMADHGVSFRPKHSRRIPDRTNVADIMSVPLFIKRPHQTQGEISDRNAETVDVLPTILDVLGAKSDAPLDGNSLLAPDARDRPRKTIFYEDDRLVIEPSFPQMSAALEHQWNRIEPALDWNEVIFPEPTRQYLGRSVSEFQTRESQYVLRMHWPRPSWEVERSRFTFRHLGGISRNQELADSQILCAIKGRIVGVTQAIDAPDELLWSVLIQPQATAPEPQDIQFFRIAGDKVHLVLERLAIDLLGRVPSPASDR